MAEAAEEAQYSPGATLQDWPVAYRLITWRQYRALTNDRDYVLIDIMETRERMTKEWNLRSQSWNCLADRVKFMTDIWVSLGVQDPLRGRNDPGGYDNMWFDFGAVRRRWIETRGFDLLDPPQGTPEHELVFTSLLFSTVEERERISAALEKGSTSGCHPAVIRRARRTMDHWVGRVRRKCCCQQEIGVLAGSESF